MCEASESASGDWDVERIAAGERLKANDDRPEWFEHRELSNSPNRYPVNDVKK